MVEARRVVLGPREELLVGSVSAWCEDRATKRASALRVGQGPSGREDGLEALRRIVGGLCECLVRGRASRVGKCAMCKARVVEAQRVVSWPRGEFMVGSVSAW